MPRGATGSSRRFCKISFQLVSLLRGNFLEDFQSLNFSEEINFQVKPTGATLAIETTFVGWRAWV